MTTVELATSAGSVLGHDDGAVVSFKGIPYAASPVGARRFSPPEPPAPWGGVRPATAYGPIAPQLRGPLDRFMGTDGQPISEDCLTLNVWTPACDDALRPVLVWIHGGAFTTGAGSAPWYDGTALAASGDVVVVTFNYRLGALGFTHLGDVDPAFAGSGNLGLHDQLAALSWVQEHAHLLGGDAGNVTVFGESAGGASVIALLATGASEGLLHKAIVQSASFTQLRERGRADLAAKELLAALEIDAGDVERLRDLPLEQVVTAQRRLLADPMAWFTAFSPVADGVLLPDTLRGLLAAAARRAVPVLVGTTRDEMQLFTALDPAYLHLDDAGLRERAAAVLGEAAARALDAYRAARPGARPGQLAAAVATDHGFRLPAIRFAEARSAAGLPTWMYWFTWASPAFGGLLGSCHGLELPFVFGNLDQPEVEVFTGGAPERAEIAEAMQRAWLGMARDRDPGWATYELEGRATMRFDLPSHVVSDPEAELRELWEAIG
jgi:para-nitrobenzyl esterase